MRTHLAQDVVGKQDLAVVLGRDFVADRIAEGLKKEGFGVRLEKDFEESLRGPDQTDALSYLKEFLETFHNQRGHWNSLWIHPGVSAWADRPELYLLAKQMGFGIFGPSAKCVSLFANRLHFLSLAEELRIPHLVLSFDPVHSAREVRKHVERIVGEEGSAPFPVVLKSIRGGGGGAGFFVLHRMEDLEDSFELWSDQIFRNVGEAIFFLERYLEDSRRVLVPFVRFMQGQVQILPKVECSLQWRHRDIVAFCPSFGLDEAMEKNLEAWTEVYANASQYVGLGVLEFLVDGSRAYLIDGKPGLNNNYALWEAAIAPETALAKQFESMTEDRPVREVISKSKNWNVSVQLYAENPFLELPQPGTIHEVQVPAPYRGLHEWSRMECRIRPAETVGIHTSGLLAHVMAQAPTKDRAVEIVRRALAEFWISGSLQTNERFVLELLEHPWVKEGVFHASFLEEEFIPRWDPPKHVLDLFGWIGHQLTGAGKQGTAWQVGDKRIEVVPGRTAWVDLPQYFKIQGLPGVLGRVRDADGQAHRMTAYPLSGEAWQIRLGTWWSVVRRLETHEPGSVRKNYLLSQVTGRVHALLFQEAAQVPAHRALLVIDSLRNLVPHALPFGVEVKEWLVKPEQLVQVGQKLAVWDAMDPNHLKEIDHGKN